MNKFKSFISYLRLSRHAYYSAMTFVGFMSGANAAGGFSVFACLRALVIINLLFAVSLILNNFHDIKIDAVNFKPNPLSSKTVSAKNYLLLGGILAALSLFLAAFSGLYLVFASLAVIAMALLYSCGPFPLKRYFPLNMAALGVSTLLALCLGYYAASPGKIPDPASLRLFIAVSAAVFFAFNVKDINDFEGDRAHRVQTVVTLLGFNNGKLAAGFLAAFGYLAFAALYGAGMSLLFTAALCGAASMGIILFSKEKVNEAALFSLVFIFFGLIVAKLIA